MKRALQFLLILSPIVIVAVFLFASRTSDPDVAQKREMKIPIAASPALPLPRQRVPVVPKSVPKADNLKACEPYWQRLRSLDLAELAVRKSGSLGPPNYDIKNQAELVRIAQSLSPSDRCRSALESHPAGAVQKELSQFCSVARQEIERSKTTSADAISSLRLSRSLLSCFHAIESYQDLLADFSLGSSFATVMDRKALAAVIRSPMPVANEQAFGRKAAAAERLLALDPQNAGAAEALLRNRMYEEMLGGNFSETNDRLGAALAKLESVSPDSAFAADVKFALAKSSGNTERMERIASDLIKDPKRWELGMYYQAYAAYLTNDTEGSKARLDEILATNPNNSVAKASLDQLNEKKSGPLKEPVFQEFASFGMSE